MAAELDAFQVVVERYRNDVWRLCASQVGVERADDCFQETMLAALRSYPQLRDPNAVKPWLLRIAARKCLDAHRTAARDPIPTQEIELGGVVDESSQDPGLLELLSGLPEKQRLAVSYRFIADLAHREIAALMEISEAAARRNVHEALNTLRARLDYGPGPPDSEAGRRA
ncbi:MAG: RNA polymerase sigma factor [Actinobacteria bacterium]|nr:RNA polymerase sigma factor [Actinomycetota bacterium]